MRLTMQPVKTLIGKTISLLPDKPYLYLLYYRSLGEPLHLKNPQRFTHKIQWLKLNGKLERFAPFADKYTVRSYVEGKVGAKHMIPLIGVWDSIDDIPFETLPNQFVLKLTKGCGYNYICKDKSATNSTDIKKVLSGWMSETFYRQERERQYKPGRQRIICEAYMEDEFGGLRDYKIHCVQGVPRYIQIDTDRFTDHKSQIRHTNWDDASSLNSDSFSSTVQTLEKPHNLDAMLKLAATLSADFPYVRVDLYSVKNELYFGELTFTPGSGIVKLAYDADIEFGKMIDIAAYKKTLPFETTAKHVRPSLLSHLSAIRLRA